MSIILSIWTVIVFFLFIAICLWAWSGSKTKDFESAAQIPFTEDDDVLTSSEGPNNG